MFYFRSSLLPHPLVKIVSKRVIRNPRFCLEQEIQVKTEEGKLRILVPMLLFIFLSFLKMCSVKKKEASLRSRLRHCSAQCWGARAPHGTGVHPLTEGPAQYHSASQAAGPLSLGFQK